MYGNKGLKKSNPITLRVDDYELEALEKFKQIHGGETAVWIRELVMSEVKSILEASDRYKKEQESTRQQVIRH